MNKRDRTAPDHDVARQKATQAAKPSWASAPQSALGTFTREVRWTGAAVEQVPTIE